MKAVLSLFIFCFIIGCDCVHERECQSFYYNTDLWQSISSNDRITFTSDNGEEITFDLIESSVKATYLAVDLQGCPAGDDVICILNADFTYTSLASDFDIKLSFEQKDFRPNVLIENQQINFGLSVREEQNSEFVLLHKFMIAPSFNASFHSVSDSLNLNGQTYFDVIQTQVDSTLLELSDKVYFWSLTASRGKGIVAFTNKEGVTYFLKE